MLNSYDFWESQGEGDYRKLSFKDVLFVHYRCPQKEQYFATYTHLNFFLYVVSGAKVFHQSGYSYPLRQGTCAFIRKGGFRQERFFDEDWQVMAFFVPDSYLQALIAEYQGVLPPQRALAGRGALSGKDALPAREALPPQDDDPAGEDPVIPLHVTELGRAFFESMVPYFFRAENVPESLVEIKFRELVCQLLSDPQNQSLLSYLRKLDDKQFSLRDVMEANYRFNLSLAEFARIANRSLSTFKRDFLALYKVPPGKWLLNKRLDHAEVLLTRSDKPVAEIADECGFENQTHFQRVFKVRFGTTPLQYRKQELHR